MWTTPTVRAHVCWMPHGTYDAFIRRHRALRDALVEEPSVRVVDDADLHLTVAMVDDPDVDRTALHNAVAEAAPGLFALPFAVPGIVVGATAITYDTTADHDPDWAPLFAAVNEAVTSVAGAPTHDPLPPYLTAAVGVGEADSGVIASRLRRTLRSPITRTRLDHLAIADVTQNPDTGRYEVTVHSRIPLPGSLAARSAALG